MDDVTRDPLLRALADARPDGALPSAADASALLARLDDQSTVTHRARTFGRVAAVATVVTAAVVSTLVLTAGSPAVRTPGTSRPTELAMTALSYDTRHAMSAAASTMVEYDQTVATTSTGVFVSDTDMWRYGTSRRGEMLDQAGNPQVDISVTWLGDTRTSTFVDYATDSYYTSTTSTVPAVLSLADPSTQIRDELADGQLTEVGHAALNGVPAIELEGTGTRGGPAMSPLMFAFAVRAGDGPAPTPTPGLMHSAGDTPVSSSATVEWWVDPITFLPMQQVVSVASGFTITSTISWLPATAANIAAVTAPIPSGFSATPGLFAVQGIRS